MTPYQALISERQRIDTEIAAFRPAAIAEVRELMDKYGITVQHLGGAAAPAPAGKPKPGRPHVPIKYRDAAGHTWTGRGIQPLWLKAAVINGASLEQFAV